MSPALAPRNRLIIQVGKRDNILRRYLTEIDSKTFTAYSLRALDAFYIKRAVRELLVIDESNGEK